MAQLTDPAPFLVGQQHALAPEHFYHPPYRAMYAALVALFERGAAID